VPAAAVTATNPPHPNASDICTGAAGRPGTPEQSQLDSAVYSRSSIFNLDLATVHAHTAARLVGPQTSAARKVIAR